MKIHPAAWSLFLLLATGIVAAGFYAAQPRAETTPPLTVPTTGNETFTLAAEHGRVVVLDFFQIWCESCLIVERDLQELAAEWNASEVRIVSVGVEPANGLDELRTYQSEHNLTWTVASDTDGAVEKFGVFALPTLVIVDPDGAIVYHKAGIAGADEIRTTVANAIAREEARVEYVQYSLGALAVTAGVASFFSPCAVGLMPGYVGHAVRSLGPARYGRALALGGMAALGLLLVFLGIGGLAVVFGQALTPYITWLAPLMGFVFILAGLLLLVRPYSLGLQRVFRPLTDMPAADDAEGRATRPLGFFLYGVGYGAGAAGCTAPILLNLVALGAVAGPATGVKLLALYAGTAALLMAVLTLVIAGGRESVGNLIRKHAHKVEVASALLFVGAGVFLLWFAERAGTLAL